MQNFTYKTFGAPDHYCQLVRINKGLKQLGGVEVNENPDFIYCNDSGFYLQAIDFKQLNQNSKLIMNVLDIPSPYVGINVNLHDWKEKLKQADKITAISHFVRKQIYHYFGLTSKVVYNPIMEINDNLRTNNIKKYNFKIMMVGRLLDRYKRVELAIASIQMAGFSEKDVITVGRENPRFGNHIGEVPESTLNELYNSVTYVVDCAQFAGLGLVACEAMAARAFPICCEDCTAANEFVPGEWLSYPTPYCISEFIRKLEEDLDFRKVEEERLFAQRDIVLSKYTGIEIARNIINLGLNNVY